MRYLGLADSITWEYLCGPLLLNLELVRVATRSVDVYEEPRDRVRGIRWEDPIIDCLAVQIAHGTGGTLYPTWLYPCSEWLAMMDAWVRGRGQGRGLKFLIRSI